MPLLLGVNLDHVATLRQARYAGDLSSPNAEPCPVDHGLEAFAGGADSITIHVRGDRRHMQDADAYRIRAEIPLPLNLEMGVTEEMIGIALKLKPDFVCLVPENRMEITTEGGLDVVSQLDRVRGAVSQLQAAGIKISLFINPDLKQVDAASEIGAEMIELHTGCFANSTGGGVDSELSRLVTAARHGSAAGLQVNAGHGIEVPHLAELNIGHSIVSRALKIGMRAAVAEMKSQMVNYTL
jgi:pyridoxine 5-phosphate synthase